MKKNILNLNGVKILRKEEQKFVNGGGFGFGCQPQIIQCNSDRDCPCTPCGVTINANGVDYFLDICAY
ncbi:hypothetical protein [Aquimarina sp. 2201CG5-10]|uniref:hypothetical protein n=1 Tax=Aquimarina callyspongiae TaxID=3098150 RepID=UPI002AB36E93|nr:hypothetical protein [Aquimarina sp. 2201CG5-10]MDY8136198.1 hypothetical protein [Aquimarina sp. 2201CG5-10]